MPTWIWGVLVRDEVDWDELEADKFAGCLVGQALGDAVGFMVVNPEIIWLFRSFGAGCN